MEDWLGWGEAIKKKFVEMDSNDIQFALFGVCMLLVTVGFVVFGTIFTVSDQLLKWRALEMKIEAVKP